MPPSVFENQKICSNRTKWLLIVNPILSAKITRILLCSTKFAPSTLEYFISYENPPISWSSYRNNMVECFFLRYTHPRCMKCLLKGSLLFKKNRTSRVNNSRIFSIKNTNFWGYYFYMNPNIVFSVTLLLLLFKWKLIKNTFLSLEPFMAQHDSL